MDMKIKEELDLFFWDDAIAALMQLEWSASLPKNSTLTKTDFVLSYCKESNKQC